MNNCNIDIQIEYYFISIPPRGTRKKRFDSFKMKTRLFDFIPDPNIHTIAYVDCDIIFGIEGSQKLFIIAISYMQCLLYTKGYEIIPVHY